MGCAASKSPREVIYADAIGHFQAGFGCTLTAYGLIFMFFPQVSPAFAWVIGLSTLILAIAVGAYLEASVFNTGGFSQVDFWAQNFGAIAAGIVLLMAIWFTGFGMLTSEMFLSLLYIGFFTGVAGVPFALYGLIPKPEGGGRCKRQETPPPPPDPLADE